MNMNLRQYGHSPEKKKEKEKAISKRSPTLIKLRAPVREISKLPLTSLVAKQI